MKLPVNYKSLHWTERKAVRLEYINRQKGRCHYCGEPLDGKPAKKIADKPVTKSRFPEGFFKWPIHLHHSHTTGMTIGAVHCHCNAVLWEYDGE